MSVADFRLFISKVGPLFLMILLGLMATASLLSWYFMDLILFDYSQFPGYVLATVAVSSLYIAWRELYRKTKPQVSAFPDIEGYREDKIVKLKLVNTGAVPVRPANVWYAVVEKTDGDILFSNGQVESFEEDSLGVGDATSVELEEGVILLQVNTVNLSYGDSKGLSLDFAGDRGMRRGPHSLDIESLDGLPEKFDYEVQRIFNEFLKEDRFGSVRIPIEDFEEYGTQKIIEQNIEPEEIEYKPGFWTRLRERYVEWKYGLKVSGRFGDGPVIRILERLEGDLE